MENCKKCETVSETFTLTLHVIDVSIANQVKVNINTFLDLLCSENLAFDLDFDLAFEGKEIQTHPRFLPIESVS